MRTYNPLFRSSACILLLVTVVVFLPLQASAQGAGDGQSSVAYCVIPPYAAENTKPIDHKIDLIGFGSVEIFVSKTPYATPPDGETHKGYRTGVDAGPCVVNRSSACSARFPVEEAAHCIVGDPPPPPEVRVSVHVVPLLVVYDPFQLLPDEGKLIET